MAISNLKRFMVPGALVIGGVTAGSMLAPVAFAAADDDAAETDETAETAADSDDAEPEDSDEAEGKRHRGHHRHLGRQIAIGLVTETLDMTADELWAEFADGKSLADIAADQGVPVEEVKAALTTEAEEHIDRAVADERLDADRAAELKEGLSDRLDEVINRTPGDGERRSLGHGRGHRGERAEAVAEFLGLSTDELRDAFADGQTLAEVAEAQGVSEEDLVAFLLDGLEERLNEAVENGWLDAEDVDEKLADAEDRIAEGVNAEPGERREGAGRRHGHRHGYRDGPTDTESGDLDTNGGTVESSLDT